MVPEIKDKMFFAFSYGTSQNHEITNYYLLLYKSWSVCTKGCYDEVQHFNGRETRS